ncbi:MAG TPA: type II toxin-antitoxin system VapC family toxin [Longimicrobiaceae bacterium]|nr:type II toxin-antitoxin system VapC family toxin [Longimicrobiaceae bacterium]
MIALDTNVLVRFLVEDDEAQSTQAAALIQRAVDADEHLFVSEIVICETVWVLGRAYKFTRREIAEILADLLRARHLEFGQADRLWKAYRAFGNGRGDFADYLIREEARGMGCKTVATFDRALLSESDFDEP